MADPSPVPSPRNSIRVVDNFHRNAEGFLEIETDPPAAEIVGFA
jgi:hypothetical protein